MIILNNIEQARDLLRRAMETQGPDFVYNDDHGACDYVPSTEYYPEDSPKAKTGCLIGVALKLAGVPDDTLYKIVGTIDENYEDWQDKGLVDISEPVMKYFNAAQFSQDSGSTWGHALADAEASLRQK
jgi:hypothetical protein